MKARSIASIVLATVVLVTACSVEPGESPAPSPSPTPNPNQLALVKPIAPTQRDPTPRQTASPSLTPTARLSPTVSSGPAPSKKPPGTPHADPALEALLPKRLSGAPSPDLDARFGLHLRQRHVPPHLR